MFGTTTCKSSLVTLPGLNIKGGFTVVSTTVDSIPTVAFPPSTITSTLPFKSSNTLWKDVVEGFPEIFAEGAAIGFLQYESIALATS
ncbi:Uncharacterised protein [Chlamydia trachomatis]|nr:Uncharacterised protein [Chlamydia trachomatis]